MSMIEESLLAISRTKWIFLPISQQEAVMNITGFPLIVILDIVLAQHAGNTMSSRRISDGGHHGKR